jgi:glycosyltransferase involved in cell wall biosynthesis
VTLLFDLTAAQSTRERIHGGGEYARALFLTLLEREVRPPVEAIHHEGRPLPEDVRQAAQAQGIPLRHTGSVAETQRLLESGRYARFFSALPYKYHSVDFGPTAAVFVIHGLRDVELPADRHAWRYARNSRRAAGELWRWWFRERYAAAARERFGRLLRVRARELVLAAASRHTRYALLTNYPFLKPEQVRVIYSPRPRKTRRGTPLPPGALGRALPQSRGYVLLINTDRWIKNAWRAIHALDSLMASRDTGLDVVAVGEPDGRRYALRHPQRFRFLPYVDDEELMRLYREAFCFLYPTLNEGFGYPPLEAMSQGTPVLASATGPLPEVLGDAPLYFDPFRPEEMQNRLLQLRFEYGLWELCSSRGLERCAQVAAMQDRMEQELIDLILTE